jgi:hypothetical protein
MCVPCFLVLLFLIYAIIGLIAGSIFNYKYKWKVDLKISLEQFGACWPKYVPILISKLKTIKKENNRNKVYDVLSDIKYYKDTEKPYQNTCNKTTGCLTMSSGLVGAYLALNKELIESIKPNGYLEFKGKRYTVDINGNILPFNLDCI